MIGSGSHRKSAAGDSAYSTQVLALIPLGIGLNLALGTLINALKLPVYLDAVGTVLVTLLVGLRAGIIVSVGSFLLGGMLINPVLPWFSGTQAAIAVYTHFVGKRGAFRSIPRTIVAGIGLGVVAGIVSAPVIVVLFGGITGATLVVSGKVTMANCKLLIMLLN